MTPYRDRLHADHYTPKPTTKAKTETDETTTKAAKTTTTDEPKAANKT